MIQAKVKTIHLIANAHLDPVWLWDRREGLNEALCTVRSVLDLMDEFPEMTFIRGESAIYQHVEKYAPALFLRIHEMVKAGRWEIVGGTVVQPDTNLPATQTLLRQYREGKNYFAKEFGVNVRAAWQADSFGHSAGLPEILRPSGIDFFAFCRPPATVVPLDEPTFWWFGSGGSRILSHRSATGAYQNERDDMCSVLDRAASAAQLSSLDNIGCFYGLGNHGGGPSRRHLREIREWAAKQDEVRVVHSGLHRLASALYDEIREKGEASIPSHYGELNFCLRGCYSSVAKFKYAFRRSESALIGAESSGSVLGAALSVHAPDLQPAWNTLLFNSFHDILPGTSIERAMDEQLDSLGSVSHAVYEAEFEILNQLAARVDTRRERHVPEDWPLPVPFLVWNPLPFTYEGLVEIEGSIDSRPFAKESSCALAGGDLEITGPNRKPLSFQEINTEHSSLVDYTWRRRVLVPLSVPAFGWNIVEMGWVPKPKKCLSTGSATVATQHSISNASWQVTARPGEQGVQLIHNGTEFLRKPGLHLRLYEDPWGSWGGMKEERNSTHLTEIREIWSITDVAALEHGPERATLWVRFQGNRSRIDLTFSVSKGRDAVDVTARLFFDDRSARLKLIFPCGDWAQYEVAGGCVERDACGEVPGGRWVVVGPHRLSPYMGFVSDSIYNFDSAEGEFRATVVRGTRFADDQQLLASESPWRPSVDCGELKFRFAITANCQDIERLSAQLQHPIVAIPVDESQGPLARSGGFLDLSPISVKLLSVESCGIDSGILIRVQSELGRETMATIVWNGNQILFGPLKPGQISMWKLHAVNGAWGIVRSDV